MDSLRHGSLFSGIGGFDLAAEWMGWENVFHCEWNEFGKRVLKYYWPDAKSYTDITKTDFSIHRGQIDILTGGFPCQPYSTAGKRLGKEDDRHLWPEMLRAVREIQPRWIVGENVSGLISWNGGLVFEEVQTDLEAEGYEVQAFILPACAVNAPHRRDRVWFVAYADGSKQGNNSRSNVGEETEIRRGTQSNVSTELCSNGAATNSDNSRAYIGMRDNCNGQTQNKERGEQPQFKFGDVGGNASNTYNQRLEGRTEAGNIGSCRTEYNQQFKRCHKRSNWSNFPTEPPVCSGNDGFPAELDGITFSKWRNESIKAGGNAIVPQVAYQIFKAIEQYNLSP
jgi:DNA (cytosine-5)-methyltransferase 1